MFTNVINYRLPFLNESLVKETPVLLVMNKKKLVMMKGIQMFVSLEVIYLEGRLLGGMDDSSWYLGTKLESQQSSVTSPNRIVTNSLISKKKIKMY